MTTTKHVTMQEAASLLGISHSTIWRLVKDGVLATHANPLDRREKLIRADDLEVFRAAQRAPQSRSRPRTLAAVDDLGVQSDDVQEYLEANWHAR